MKKSILYLFFLLIICISVDAQKSNITPVKSKKQLVKGKYVKTNKTKLVKASPNKILVNKSISTKNKKLKKKPLIKNKKKKVKVSKYSIRNKE
ncbi:MAG: hypothetical protein CMP51_00530 [Flavobacteriales bacterium]|nr:hypothetical protein [Flavobacteriales bacterium]|tara:strand:+ start:495 stop:773 length:279 start_codon:yes stop_codon:yes gene_type:complete